MKDRIDPLIEDRAPWLFRPTLAASLARPTLNRLLGYDRTCELGKAVEHLSSADIMTVMADRLARDVTVSGLGHLPRHGPALIVANHPTGIADGIILHSALRQVRQDAYYFANHDILKVLPQMADTAEIVAYATTLEMSYSGRIGSTAADLGLSFQDMATDDIAGQSPALAWLTRQWKMHC